MPFSSSSSSSFVPCISTYLSSLSLLHPLFLSLFFCLCFLIYASSFLVCFHPPFRYIFCSQHPLFPSPIPRFLWFALSSPCISSSNPPSPSPHIPTFIFPFSCPLYSHIYVFSSIKSFLSLLHFHLLFLSVVPFADLFLFVSCPQLFSCHFYVFSYLYPGPLFSPTPELSFLILNPFFSHPHSLPIFFPSLTHSSHPSHFPFPFTQRHPFPLSHPSGLFPLSTNSGLSLFHPPCLLYPFPFINCLSF